MEYIWNEFQDSFSEKKSKAQNSVYTMLPFGEIGVKLYTYMLYLPTYA